MRFAILSLIGVAVLISPCVYDTDPREPSPLAALIAQGDPQLAAPGIDFSSRNPDISTETMQ
ncbi:hypothetical protein FHS21_002280 [Phyllobacterium trifolii]|jgi:hypothetical protein|uniref:Uncharacterized protein n=1 Tax=Phyllobacterium trifolii TaxID=300193 RepID=A0A839U479_9HYPH|nr:hypothetical protein [Phyllobacterium trifolii]MBB3145866.1 hypothetical protein [Phyllobacterium trifolii]